MLRAVIVSSSRAGTWETSLTVGGSRRRVFALLGERLRTLGSSAASQREVLHPGGQVRIPPGPQVLELLPPLLEIPDLVMAPLPDEHHLAVDVREVAHLGRKEHATRAVDLDVLREGHEQALPDAELAIEAGKRHHPGADRLPGGRGKKQEAAVRMGGEHQLYRAPLGQRIASSRRHRHAPFGIQADLGCPLKHIPPHVFPLPHTVVIQLQRVKRGKWQFILVRQRLSEGFSSVFSLIKFFIFKYLSLIVKVICEVVDCAAQKERAPRGALRRRKCETRQPPPFPLP